MDQQVSLMKQKYDKKQTSIMTTSFLTAAIGFVIICLIGYGVSLLWNNVYDGITYNNYENALNSAKTLDTLYAISGVAIFISFILSIIWSFRVHKASLMFGLITIGVYCFSSGIGFGTLFYVFEVRELLTIFGMIGFILLGTYLTSRMIKDKTAMTLSKIAWRATIFYLIGSLVISLCMVFIVSDNTIKIIGIISSTVGGLLSVVYLIVQFYIIQRSDEFIEDNTMRRNIGLFFGFNILVNLINLVWKIARLILYTRD